VFENLARDKEENGGWLEFLIQGGISLRVLINCVIPRKITQDY